MKPYFQDNDTEIHSTHSEVQFFVTERFIRNLKDQNVKIYLTLVSKIVYTNKLDDIINKYNNTYYSTIKMKRVDVT